MHYTFAAFARPSVKNGVRCTGRVKIAKDARA
jgi:hypothetical protein